MPRLPMRTRVTTAIQLTGRPYSTTPPPSAPTPLPLPAPPSASPVGGGILLSIALVLAVAACITWLLLRYWPRLRSIEIAPASPPDRHEFERRLAGEIEAEILCRTAP